MGVCSARQLTVLIVDDDASVTHTYARVLLLKGYNVTTAFDAETALRAMAAVRTDAVLVDLRMPLMDGVSFLRRLRAQEHDQRTPVALITGDYFIDERVARELRELDAMLYFKPLWNEELVAILQRLLPNIR